MAEGNVSGTVLDAGCGTGEHALLVASAGHSVLGFDVAETALAMAREKARERKLDVAFVAADALALGTLQRTFDTVLDCGLFHTFDPGERARYVQNLALVTAPGAVLYVLCFRDDGSGSAPHPLAREDVVAAFEATPGWNVAAIEPDRVRTRFHGEAGAPAWLVTVRRV